MAKISVVINTLNEERNLPRALTSIKDFADEVVVCDMYSDDKTVEIAKKFGAKVYDHKRTAFVEPARNFALSKATSDWILILDADEEVVASLNQKLKNIVEEDSVDYVRIPRKNIIFGKWLRHSRWWPDYNIRFFKKGKVIWDGKIHSVPKTLGQGIDLEARQENALIHYNYLSLDQYLERLTRYSRIQADQLIENGYKFSWQDLIRKPMSEFLSRFFAGEGYKDGVHGLALACLQAFSEFVVYVRVWEKQGFEEQKTPEIFSEIEKTMKELQWWLLTRTKNPFKKLLQKIKLP